MRVKLSSGIWENWLSLVDLMARQGNTSGAVHELADGLANAGYQTLADAILQREP